jgi:MFS family permease
VSHNAASSPPRPDLLDSLDDSKISRFQIKIMFVSGKGFFTDAYDRFVIGIVVWPNYTFLLISRAVLGIGIGRDYPVSATIMSEHPGKNTRGRMVGAVFANQAAGLIVGPLIASIFLASGLSDNLTWRLLLGLAAVPGLAVFYLRPAGPRR